MHLTNTCVKSSNVLLKFQLQGNHSSLNDLIKKLDDTINVLLEAEKNPSKRKAFMEKNHASVVPAAAVVPVTKPNTSKASPVPRAWFSKNSSVRFIFCLLVISDANRKLKLIFFFFF